MVGHFKECKCGENMDLFERHVHCTARGHIPETDVSQMRNYSTQTNAQ